MAAVPTSPLSRWIQPAYPVTWHLHRFQSTLFCWRNYWGLRRFSGFPPGFYFWVVLTCCAGYLLWFCWWLIYFWWSSSIRVHYCLIVVLYNSMSHYSFTYLQVIQCLKYFEVMWPLFSAFITLWAKPRLFSFKCRYQQLFTCTWFQLGDRKKIPFIRRALSSHVSVSRPERKTNAHTHTLATLV